MSTLRSISEDLAAAVAGVAPAVVAVHARPRLPSSGVQLRPGVVVTADHAIRVEQEIRVVWADGHVSPAALVARDAGTDLAVLRVEDESRPVTPLGERPDLRTGHLVLAMGYGPRVSLGVVSTVGGAWRTWRGGEVDQFVRLDLTLYPGFSGGPLLDASGRVAGIVTSGLARDVEMAVPVATVARVVDQLLSGGRVRRAYLGVGLQPVTLPEATATRSPGAGGRALIVVKVEPEGPAAHAGLMLGDVLTALDGAPLREPDDVQVAVAGRAVGSTFRISLLRAGAPLEIPVTLGERPPRPR
jgi:S1-C subfamily serine protease